MGSITVTFPETATLPAELRDDPERARYLIVGSLYVQGHISRGEAAGLAGDSDADFAVKLERYGFHPQAEAAAKQATAGGHQTRWQALARRLDDEGFLDGRSGEAQELLAQCRLAL